MRQKIKKGDAFLCVKDFVMQDGTIAFKKGVIYFSEQNKCLTNTWGQKEHYMDTCDIFTDHFKDPKSDVSSEYSKLLLERILELKNEN